MDDFREMDAEFRELESDADDADEHFFPFS